MKIMRSVAAVGAAVLTVGALSACSGATGEFTAKGAISVPRDPLLDAVGGGPLCVADEGYDDIHTDGQVTIEGSNGDTAVAMLATGSSDGTSRCRFTFTVEHVPDGQKSYKIRIGSEDRGTITAQRPAMDNLQITIG